MSRHLFFAHLAGRPELPMPGCVSFVKTEQTTLVSLHFDSMAEAHAWAMHLGITALGEPYFQKDFARRQVGYMPERKFGGWRVSLLGAEDVPDDERERLLAERAKDIAQGGEEAAGPERGGFGPAADPTHGGAGLT